MPKRKRAEKAVARITRDISAPLHLDRTVSVHATAAGRLTQTTSFLPSTFDAIEQPEGQEHIEDRESSAYLEPNDEPSGGFDGDASGWSEGQSEPFTEDADDVDDSEPDSPLFEWVKQHRATYLDELIRHEARAGFDGCTRKCGREGVYRCKDCFGCRQWCRICFVEQHAHAPLHRALVSNPSFFLYSALRLSSIGPAITLRMSPLRRSESGCILAMAVTRVRSPGIVLQTSPSWTPTGCIPWMYNSVVAIATPAGPTLASSYYVRDCCRPPTFGPPVLSLSMSSTPSTS